MKDESLKALKHISETGLDKRIVFVSGDFNIIHPGHLRLLRFAKECGDYLVVGLFDSSSSRALIDENLRMEGIRSISWVDYGFILREPPESFVRELKPAFVVKGKEYEEQYNPEDEVLKEIGGKLLFSSGDISFSSIDLIRQEWKELNLSSIRKPMDFLSRHKLEFNQLLYVLEQMNKLRVCVIGDTIVDEYITCDALGMSQEDPAIVVTPILQEKYIGGAAIVASHASGLGATVNFMTVFGNDEAANFTKKALKQNNVNVNFYVDESRPTTLKQRYRARQKTLLRVSHLRQHAINADIRKNILGNVESLLDNIDLLIFADFNYGCLPQSLVDKIVEQGLKKGIMMVADSQSSSQIGDISRFNHMMLITPTEREARFALHDFESGLVVLAEKLLEKCKAKNILMTLADEGVMIHAEAFEDEWLTDRLQAFNSSPKDVAGAGDSFLTCSAMALAVSGNIWLSAYLGSLAAASLCEQMSFTK